VPLAWDNVVHGSRGLGYVVATHQWIRQARPAHTAFTAYCPLDAESGAPAGDRQMPSGDGWRMPTRPR
jgi:hypothetical protein